MPQQVLKVVRPTKIELIKLRRRLALASRIQKIVKDRVSILILEFLQIAKQTVEIKSQLLAEFLGTYKALSIAAGYHGYIALEKELIAIHSFRKGANSYRAGLRNCGWLKKYRRGENPCL